MMDETQSIKSPAVAQINRVYRSLQRRIKRWRHDRRMVRLARAVAQNALVKNDIRPVVFFNASTRLTELSQNAAFSLLTSWMLRLSGIRVVHFVCQAGMSRCVLGTDPDDPSRRPPCQGCTRWSKQLFTGSKVKWFDYQPDKVLIDAVKNLSLEELMEVSFQGCPLGALVLPALRWRLRRHNISDDQITRGLYKEFILSAWNVHQEFETLLDEVNPQAVILFNGQFFPEAVAKWVSEQREIRVVTHEVGLHPNSVFFTDGEATAYPIHIPQDYELSDEQNARLDAYLSERFKGAFTMAGIRFWPEMRALDKAFLEQLENFKQVVPIFTNVIFDTSQPHSNVIFPDMFAWLDRVYEVIRRHPETMFIIRAHPDELRSDKRSQETVAGWVKQNNVDSLPNVLFIDAREFVSSYEMIQRSKFVMIYNSTIGLEAVLLGKPVLSAGKARFSSYPIVEFPGSIELYESQLENWLNSARIELPDENRRHARRFLFFQLYKVSLHFNDYIQPGLSQTSLQLKDFEWYDLMPENSKVSRIVRDGLVAGRPFLMSD